MASGLSVTPAEKTRRRGQRLPEFGPTSESSICNQTERARRTGNNAPAIQILFCSIVFNGSMLQCSSCVPAAHLTVDVVVADPAGWNARRVPTLELAGSAGGWSTRHLIGAITTVILPVAHKVAGNAAPTGAHKLIGRTGDISWKVHQNQNLNLKPLFNADFEHLLQKGFFFFFLYTHYVSSLQN